MAAQSPGSLLYIYVSYLLHFLQVDRKKWGGGDTALSNLANMPLQETASVMEGMLSAAARYGCKCLVYFLHITQKA